MLFAGIVAEKVVSINTNFMMCFAGSCQDLMINLASVINGGRDFAGMQVREDVALNHSIGHLISK